MWQGNLRDESSTEMDGDFRNKTTEVIGIKYRVHDNVSGVLARVTGLPTA